jgi:hypothetical protein
MEDEKVLVRRGVRFRRERVKSVWKQTWSLAGKNLRREPSERPLMNPKHEVFRLLATRSCKTF